MTSDKMSKATMESSVHPENTPSILDNLPTSDEVSEVGNEDPMMTKNKRLKYKQRRRDWKARAQSGNNKTSGSSQPHSRNSTSTVAAGSVGATSGDGVLLSPFQAANANSTTAVMSIPTDQENVATQLNDLKVGDKVSDPTGLISGDGVPPNPSKATRVEPKSDKKKTTISGTGFSSTSTSIIVPATKPRFGFDDNRDQLKCRKHGCDKLTNCYDGDSVHCPRCGLLSLVRYCSLHCLLDPDMRFHWAQECGHVSFNMETFPYRLDTSTLVARTAASRPYILCLRDNPARHRQAVYHSANGAAGDYFVFNDCSLIPKGSRNQMAVVGRGGVIAIVSIIPDYGYYTGKSIFHEVLQDCLRIGFQRPDKCLALVDMITMQLVNSFQWTPEVQNCLVFQMKNEFAYDVPREMLLRFSLHAPASA